MEDLASNRQCWRDICSIGAKQLNNDINRTAERRCLRRPKQPNVDGNFPCNVCDCICKSRIGLTSHQFTCARPDSVFLRWSATPTISFPLYSTDPYATHTLSWREVRSLSQTTMTSLHIFSCGPSDGSLFQFWTCRCGHTHCRGNSHLHLVVHDNEDIAALLCCLSNY